MLLYSQCISLGSTADPHTDNLGCIHLKERCNIDWVVKQNKMNHGPVQTRSVSIAESMDKSYHLTNSNTFVQWTEEHESIDYNTLPFTFSSCNEHIQKLIHVQMLKICQSKDYTEMDSQNKNAWNNLWMRWMNLTIYFTKGFLLVIVLGPVLKGLHALCTGSKFKQKLNSNSCISHSIGFKE